MTPFSDPALERGLAAALFAMVRHWHPDLSPARGAMAVGQHRDVVDQAIAALRSRAARQGDEATANRVAALSLDIADSWVSEVEKARSANLTRGYSRFDLDRKGLARPILLPPGEDPVSEGERKFAAPTSMRDTEPAVHLWLRFGLGRKSV